MNDRVHPKRPYRVVAPTSPAEAHPSITAAYGRLTPAQYHLAARVWNGEDVRFYSPGVNHNVAYALIGKNVLGCAPVTCRFFLMPPANAVREQGGIHAADAIQPDRLRRALEAV